MAIENRVVVITGAGGTTVTFGHFHIFALYNIRLMYHLGSQWTNWFERLDIPLEEEGDALLTGPVVD